MIKNDAYMMSVLQAVEKLKLNDAWVCAGFVRNKVWDVLHHVTTPLNDIDVIYFDRTDTSLKKEKQLEEELKSLVPNQPWSVKKSSTYASEKWFSSFCLIV